MKKILVTTIDELIPSESAYQVCELAQSMNGDLVFLYLVESLDSRSQRRGRFAIEVFEDASQYYDVNVDGRIMSGEPIEQIKIIAKELDVELILMGATDQIDWHPSLKKIESSENIPSKVFDPDRAEIK